MMLPVSSYEELLARVRSLRHETIQLQRELSASSSLLLDHNDNEGVELECDNATTSPPGVLAGSPLWGVGVGVGVADDSSRGSRSSSNSSLHAGADAWSTSAAYQHFTTESLLTRLNIMPKLMTCNKEGSMLEPKEEDERNESKNDLDQIELEGLSESLRDHSLHTQQTSEERHLHQHDGLMALSGITSTSEPGCDRDRLTSLYHGTWPVEQGLWHSGPSSLGAGANLRGMHSQLNGSQEVSSTVSFTSSNGAGPPSCTSSLEGERRSYSSHQLGHKVDMVYNLLSMLRHERQDMSRTLLAMSSSPDSCAAMRQSGVLPLLVQLLHSPGQSAEVRARAAQALRNIVQANPDTDRRGRRESRVLRLLEQLREYCENLRTTLQGQASPQDDGADHHPGPAIAALMKLSFDEEHRHAMCLLGGLLAVAELIQMDHEAHGGATSDQACVTLRRFAGMALTNLTFGDGANKALLCSLRPFMRALVAQLASPSEDLRQVTASVLRNLSWRADGPSKQALREVGAVPALVRAAMAGTKEATLKSILSALWNLSAHCTMNKVDICEVDGALGFLVDMLSYDAPSKTLAIVENAGGILRNISSHIAVREDYRQILRDHNCLQTLLQQLKSPSLTVVSNACGALWNLSAHCPCDQRTLWELGAVAMLRSLVHSKHKMISMGSSAALKNLLAARPHHESIFPLDATAKGMGLPQLPSLYIRKQRALEQELDQTLAETCDNIEPSSSPPPAGARSFHSDSGAERIVRSGHRSSSLYQHQRSVSRSESKDSVTSTHSDSIFERVMSGSRVPPSTARLLRHRGICGGKLSEENRDSSSRERRSHSLPHTARLSSDETKVNRAQGLTGDIQSELKHNESTSPDARSGFSSLQATSSSAVSDHFERTSTTNTVATKSTTKVHCDYTADVNEVVRNGLPVTEHKNSKVTPRKSASAADIPLTSARAKAGVMYKKKMSSVYGDYAETDLDQPTDYSLQYQEEEDEESTGTAHRQLHGNDQDRVSYYSDAVHEDTLKTYCTEGTPYETPYNFSTATSMSDLRCEPPTPQSEKAKEEEVETPHTTSNNVSTGDVEITTEQQPAVVTQSQNPAVGFASPEKPIVYGEENAPCFYGVSSPGSVGSHPTATEDDTQLDTATTVQTAPPTTQGLHLQEAVIEDAKETRDGTCVNKVVTFAGAEETPLMFSRCSSLGSLSSFEQHSIHDDRSSVISDFSRRTSGAVSPSELPDSPTQTVPPSPGPHHSGLAPVTGGPQRSGHRAGDFLARLPERTHLLPAARHIAGRSNAPKGSVFEDDVAAFKEEDTPVEFSRATSLSSLTIDDEPKISNDTLLKEVRAAPRQSPSLQIMAVEDCTEKHDREKGTECGELAPVSEGEEEADEDMLNACISVGMQGTGRQRCYERVSRSSAGHSSRSPGRPSGIPLKIVAGTRRQGKVPPAPQPQHSYIEVNAGELCEDTVHMYCTEGTPAAGLSHAGSRSDLSVLSLPGTGAGTGDLSDDNLSAGGDDNMLAECIQSGMPKAKVPSTSGIANQPVTRTDLVCSSTRVTPRRLPSLSSRLRVPTTGQAAQDELETFATEDSPHNFSIRSSLSDLTIDSREPATSLKGSIPVHPVFQNGDSDSNLPISEYPDSTIPPARGTSPSSLDATAADENSCPASGDPGVSCASASEEVQTVLSRGGSLSSLSVDSLGSAEPTPSEQALLEQCISSGMPKSRGSSSRAAGCRIPLPVDRNMSSVQKAEAVIRTRNRGHGVAHIESRMAVLSLGEEGDETLLPKNEQEPPPLPATVLTAVDGGGGVSITTTTTTITTTTATATTPTGSGSHNSRVLQPQPTHKPIAEVPDNTRSVFAEDLCSNVSAGRGDENGPSEFSEVSFVEHCNREWKYEELDNRIHVTEVLSAENSADVEVAGMRNSRILCEVGGNSGASDNVVDTHHFSSIEEPILECIDNKVLDATTEETRNVNLTSQFYNYSATFSETDADYLANSDNQDFTMTAFGSDIPVHSQLHFGNYNPSANITKKTKNQTDAKYRMKISHGTENSVDSLHNSTKKTVKMSADSNFSSTVAEVILPSPLVKYTEYDHFNDDDQEKIIVNKELRSESACNTAHVNGTETDVKQEAHTFVESSCNKSNSCVEDNSLPTTSAQSEHKVTYKTVRNEVHEYVSVENNEINDVIDDLLDNLEQAENMLGKSKSGSHTLVQKSAILYGDTAGLSNKNVFVYTVKQQGEDLISSSENLLIPNLNSSETFTSVFPNFDGNNKCDDVLLDHHITNDDSNTTVNVFGKTPNATEHDNTETQVEVVPKRSRRDCRLPIQRLLSDIQEHTLSSPVDDQVGLDAGDADVEIQANVVPDDRTYSLDSLSPDSNLNRPNIATSSSSEWKQKESPVDNRLPEWQSEDSCSAKMEVSESVEGEIDMIQSRAPGGDHTISDIDSVQTPSPVEAAVLLSKGGITDSAAAMRQSFGAGDTWNEEVSPNDISFPSLTVPEDSDSGGLDAIRPPSLMTSLISMTTSSETGAALAAEAEAVAAAINSTAQQSGGTARHNRKRSLPSLMVRRALGSLENLSGDNGCVSASSSCTSQLDHVRPPADMESSMLSVASITSEVAEVEEDLPDGGASCSTGGEDLTESGSGGGSTSAGNINSSIKQPSTTRMVGNGVVRPTPRQRRQAARDRYRTYTVNTAAAAAAELHATMAAETVEEGVEVTTPTAEQPPPSEISPPPENECVIRTGTYRITPKQRRQEDRQRFQTQVLDKLAVTSPTSPVIPLQDAVTCTSVPENTHIATTAGVKRHRRSSEGRDRFRTRTLDGDKTALNLKKINDNESQMLQTSEEPLLNSLLEREANILAEDLETLRTGDSLLLECETLSLVSIDSENTSESGQGVEGVNGDVDEDEEATHPQLLHPVLDDEGEEGDAEEKTLRAGGCDTPDPDDVLGLGETTEPLVFTAEVRTVGQQEHIMTVRTIENVEDEDCVQEESVSRRSSLAADPEAECEHVSCGHSDDQSSSSTDDDCAQKRPRIVKPVARSRDGSADAGSSGGSPKPIRGRRKPLHRGRSGIPVTAVAPLKVPPLASNKVPQQKQQQQKTTTEHQEPDPQFRPPERQGTFTKDEPVAIAASKPNTSNTSPAELSKKKKRPVSGIKPLSSTLAATVTASASAANKKAATRREATSKIAGLWKKAEESKTKPKQQLPQKKETKANNSGGSATHTISSAPQKMTSASGRGRGISKGPISRIPTADSAAGTTRTEKVLRREQMTSTRAERGGNFAARGSSAAIGRIRKVREEPAATGSAPQAASGVARPFARSANPRPASAIVQPFNYSPPTSQAQQQPTVRSQIPTLVKREEPPLPLNTASIRITTV